MYTNQEHTQMLATKQLAMLKSMFGLGLFGSQKKHYC